MRIIAGSSGGHRLTSPKTDDIRPTTDRIRESLFAMLGSLEGAVVVDGFAGSGALGLEALSRGAKHCYFFDRSREAISTINENARRTALDDRAVIEQVSFRRGLSKFIDGTPDLWFLDPPYHTDCARQALVAMHKATTIVTPGALVVWESDRNEDLIEVEDFQITKQKEYGRTRLVFFRRA